MNATDTRVIGGAAAATAGVVALVTVVVYEGHVKVTGRNQQTVVVQPGATYAVPAAPPTTVEPPVVAGMFDRNHPTSADLAIPAGERATIHAPALPVSVEVVGQGTCTLAIERGVDPLTVSGMIVTLDAGSYQYRAMCDGKFFDGRLIVMLDDGRRPLAPLSRAVNPINADGRHYRISYQRVIPEIVVKGGSGTLHVERDRAVRTYTSPRIPGVDLADGEYTYWFTPEKKSKLVIDFDQTAPQINIANVTWSDPVSVMGTVTVGWSLGLGSIAVPIADDGRFSARVTADGGKVVLRAEHPQRGTHYYLLRDTSRTATVAKQGSHDAAIVAVIAAAKRQIAQCLEKAVPLANQSVVLVVEIAYEAAMKCKDVYELSYGAYRSACGAKLTAKVDHYYGKLNDNDKKVLGNCDVPAPRRPGATPTSSRTRA